MQVLFRGVKPSEVEYQGTCNPLQNGCGTRVKFKRSEAKEVQARTQQDKAYLEVGCPVCDKKIRSFFDKYVEPYQTWHGRD